MAFIEKNGIRFLTFDIFPRDVVQGVITRRGGVSPAPWQSLNVGGTVGDEKMRVAENRKRSFAALGRSTETTFEVWQVHSADVVYGDAPLRPGSELRRADIILTDRPEVTLFMRFADCVPIFFGRSG